MIDSSESLLKNFTFLCWLSLWIILVIEISDNMCSDFMMECTLETDFGIRKWQPDFHNNFILKIQDRCPWKTLSRKHDLHIILQANFLQIIINHLYNLLLSKYGIWRWSVCIIDKYFVRNMFVLMVNLIIFRGHHCLVLKMWIVRIFMLEKVWHLFEIVWGEKIF